MSVLQSAGQRCSLLLVDRSLDLTSCALHNSEGLGDEILSLLPRLPGHSCGDVAVSMAPICTTSEHVVLVPGCLAQPGRLKDQHLLRTILTSRKKVCGVCG